MSKDLCLDCGMLLSPNTGVCAVCGFDNNFKRIFRYFTLILITRWMHMMMSFLITIPDFNS